MSLDILRLLKKADGFASGERISSELGISRTAVWKRIKTLRAEGFVITAVPSKGYRLIKAPDLSAEDIAAGVLGGLWKDVFIFRSVGSTNEVASSKAPGTVVIADMQEQGRGRLGRTWVSPPGLNIYMSLVIRPDIPPRDATLLTVLASLSAAVALKNETSLPVSIKWPNDLTISGRKIGGILTEIKADPDRINLAVIGLGINVNSRAKDFPDDLRALATSVKIETGRSFQRGEVIIALLREFERWHEILKSEGKGSLLRDWKGLSSTLGRNVRVTTGEGTITGTAEDIDDEGMLILRLPSGGRKRISAGDLTILR